MMKRTLALLLLMCTVFLLCACPGDGPVVPPAPGNECTNCGGAGCEVCQPGTKPPVNGITVSPDDADYSIVFGAGAAIDGTGDKISDRAPVLTEKTYDETKAEELPATRFFTQITFDGGVYRATDDATVPLRNVADRTYTGKETVMLLPRGLVIEDCENLTLKNMIIVGDVTVKSSNIIFENVQFLGKLTVEKDASSTVFNACRFSSLTNKGEDTAVLNSYIPFEGVGITDSGVGLYVSNCRLQGTGTAISSAGAELDVRLSTIVTDENGIGVEMKGEDVVNSIVALSVIRGGQKSIVLDGVLNTTVVRNSLVSVEAKGNKNIYICDNEMGGRLFSENNNYFLADGNTYPADDKDHRAVVEGNENVNGDTLTDVDARLEVGANEELLPHVDKELFVGMERKRTVREPDRDSKSAVYDYIMRHAEDEEYVVVAPGVYTTTGPVRLTEVHNNTTVYAYGVYVEAVEYADRNYAEGHIRVKGAENIAFKGLSIGFAQQSCGQIYILKKIPDTNKVIAVAGAGFWNEFSNSGSAFMSATDVGLQRAGTYNGLGDYFVSSVAKNADGTLTVSLTSTAYEAVKKGDIMTCRLGGSATVISTNTSKNVLYKDFTLYGYARAFAFYEYENTGGVTYYRVLDTNRTGKIIDEETYDWYRELQDEYGVDLEISIDELPDGTLRFRGSPAHVASIDGVHSEGSVNGSTVISSKFEGICDDMANQKSTHARLSEYIENDDGTVTIIYKGNMSNFAYSQKKADAKWEAYCASFRAGDRVFIYTSDGQVVCDGPAISDGVSYTPITSVCEGVTPKQNNRFAVTVKAEYFHEEALKGFSLLDDSYKPDHKVLVDNMSRASYGFRIENVLVQNTERSGIRAKAAGGVVTNCTFRNVAKTATSMVYEIWWGESGVASEYTFEKNLIDNTGYAHDAPTIDDPSDSYRYTPICIMGLGGNILDEDHMLFKNIIIRDNKFVNRYLGHYNHAIYIRAASGVTITGNDFGYSDLEDGLEIFCQVLYLDRVVNVELSGNTYSPYVDPTVEGSDYSLVVEGTKYASITGTDISINGVSQIKDKT